MRIEHFYTTTMEIRILECDGDWDLRCSWNCNFQEFCDKHVFINNSRELIIMGPAWTLLSTRFGAWILRVMETAVYSISTPAWV